MDKCIYTYWKQGFKDCPIVIKKCAEQFKRLHPDWSIYELDDESIFNYIDPLPIKHERQNKMSIQHKSDLYRTQLLIKYGGVWADPTVFMTLRLDDWIFENTKSGIFLFSRPGRDRIISNWFIAAEPNNPILVRLYNELCDYWNNNGFRNLGRRQRTKFENDLNRVINRNLDWPRIWFSPVVTKLIKLYPYMVYHYKFYDVLKKDNTCQKIWDNTPKISSDLPHKLQRFGLLSKVNEESREFICSKSTPLHKLTWKLKSDEIPSGSNLDYLFQHDQI